MTKVEFIIDGKWNYHISRAMHIFCSFSGCAVRYIWIIFIGGVLDSFLIEEEISQIYRDKGKNMLSLIKLVIQYIIPPMFVMIQAGLLLSIFSQHSDVMQEKDASGNLPGILSTYNTGSFIALLLEMILLYIYTAKILRGGDHPNKVVKMVEKALVPGFVTLGTIGLLFIGLLYNTIVNFLTDG